MITNTNLCKDTEHQGNLQHIVLYWVYYIED